MMLALTCLKEAFSFIKKEINLCSSCSLSNFEVRLHLQLLQVHVGRGWAASCLSQRICNFVKKVEIESFPCSISASCCR